MKIFEIVRPFERVTPIVNCCAHRPVNIARAFLIGDIWHTTVSTG